MEIQIQSLFLRDQEAVFRMGWSGSRINTSNINYLIMNGESLNISNLNKTDFSQSGQYHEIMIMHNTNLYNFLAKHGYYPNFYGSEQSVSNGKISSTNVTSAEEWRPMSRRETIQRGTDTINVSYLLPSQSYTEQGIDGVVLVTWEEKFVNGVTTGEKRNERRTTQTSVVNNKRYVGTKTEYGDNVIDFRNVNQVFYGGYEIQSVYYMGNKLWEKVSGLGELLFEGRLTSNWTTISNNYSAYRTINIEKDGVLLRSIQVSDLSTGNSNQGYMAVDQFYLEYMMGRQLYAYTYNSNLRNTYKFYGVR